MDELKELRIKVAQCCRMLEFAGLIDFSGHVSARVPGEDACLINGFAAQRSEVTEKEIVKIDLEGNLLEGNQRAPLECVIHTAIYKKHPEIMAVTHLHADYFTTLFVAQKKWMPVVYHGAIFAPEIPIIDDCRHIDNKERSERCANLIGESAVVAMRGHGAVVATKTLESCFLASVYLEHNAEQLYQAYAIGEPKGLSQEEIDEGSKKIWTGNHTKAWEYFRSKAQVPF